MANALVNKYMRSTACHISGAQGAASGQIINGTLRAIDKVGLDQDKTVIISGIGCSGRSPGYLNFDTIHTMR